MNFNVSIEVCGKRLWNSKLKLKLNSRHFFLFITYNGFRISHWFLEHHFLKQHDQIEKDLKKKHLRIKIPSHKNTFTEKKPKKIYHLIIKHFLRIGKHHLHNSHKTKKRQENGPKFTTIIYFSLFSTNFSVTWKVNYKTEEFTAESLFFTGSIFVGSHDTYKCNAWILVRGYVNSCGRIIHKYWSSRDNKDSTVLSNLSTIVFITVTSTGYYVRIWIKEHAIRRKIKCSYLFLRKNSWFLFDGDVMK